MPSSTLKFFADFIESHLGIVYSEDNYFQLENRLQEIAKKHALPNLEALQQALLCGSHPSWQLDLLDASTNNETSFFRDQKIFDGLRDFVVPNLRAAGLNGHLRIWSAAASTGQEALSIAMTLTQMNPAPSFEILASDISTKALGRIQEGDYSELEIQRGLPLDHRAKFFEPRHGRWVAKPSIRAMIKTERINLCHSFNHITTKDIIFCRNVLIYQNVPRKAEIIAKLHRCISPGGFLILGAGESMIGLSQDFAQREFNNAIFYQKSKSAM